MNAGFIKMLIILSKAFMTSIITEVNYFENSNLMVTKKIVYSLFYMYQISAHYFDSERISKR